MKSSDVEKQIAERNREIPLGTTLSDGNVQKVRAGVVDFRQTRIIETEGAVESSPPYMRDAAMADVSRRKRMHTTLDRLLCDAGYSEERAGAMHVALDRMMDEEREPEDEEPEETAEDDEGEMESVVIPKKEMHAALDMLLDAEAEKRGAAKVTATDRSTAMDSSPRRTLCFCCGNLGGVKGYNAAHPRVH